MIHSIPSHSLLTLFDLQSHAYYSPPFKTLPFFHSRSSFPSPASCSFSFSHPSSPLTNSHSLPTEQVFVWNLADGQRLYYDNQETVRFRIEEEIWTDQSPIGPKEREDAAGTVMRASAGSPYVVKGSMADAGLGPCLWWDGDEE
jgi:hypothetical protein